MRHEKDEKAKMRIQTTQSNKSHSHNHKFKAITNFVHNVVPHRMVASSVLLVVQEFKVEKD